ncbi:NB-ARC domains-containing protein [Tanacetum coccineum]
MVPSSCNVGSRWGHGRDHSSHQADTARLKTSADSDSVWSLEAPHVINVDSQLWAGVIHSGPNHYPVNASYKTSESFDFQDAVGASLEEICKVVPARIIISVGLIIENGYYVHSSSELVKILECKQIECPKYEVQIVFYDVKPDVVRKQTDSYAEAFDKHQRSNRPEVDNWKEALFMAANLSGWIPSKVKFTSIASQRIHQLAKRGLSHVDDHEQLEALAGSASWFCPRSLIIFTGKDKQLLRSHRVDEIHDMYFLNEDQSLELFCSYAFKEKDSSENSEKFLRKL